MLVKIEYKSQVGDIPYCAFTYSGTEYECSWSSVSFADAKEKLIEKLKNGMPQPPAPEEVEI